MRRFLFVVLLLACLIRPVYAMNFTAPPAPEEAQELLRYEPESFGQGLMQIVREAIQKLLPELAEAAGACLSVIALLLLASVIRMAGGAALPEWVAAVGVGTILLGQTSSLIHLAADTVTQLSEYGKLLLPVMTAAMAAQGGITASAALYTGTVLFDTLLSAAAAAVLVPMVYMFLALAIAKSATGEEMLGKLGELVKGSLTWLMKTGLYIFTGYMSITGVVSGTADASAVKVAKLSISGMVPVVGGILSDASEAVVVGAGVMKNAAGVYGLLAVIAIWIAPFLKIGLQYLLLKLTAVFCSSFGIKKASDLIQDFSDAMAILLGLVGSFCLFLVISTVCFMKGVS